MSIELGINCNQDLKRETDDATAYKADPLLPPMYRFVNELGQSDITERLDFGDDDTPALVAALREIAPYPVGQDQEQMDTILSLALQDYDDTEIARLMGIRQATVTSRLDGFCDDAFIAVDSGAVDPAETIARHVRRLRGLSDVRDEVEPAREDELADEKPVLTLASTVQKVAATALGMSMQEIEQPQQVERESPMTTDEWHDPSDDEIMAEPEVDPTITDDDIDEIVQDVAQPQPVDDVPQVQPPRIVVTTPPLVRPVVSPPKQRPHLDLTPDAIKLPVSYLAEADEDSAELIWQQKALCAQTDPEAFFPEKGGSTREAKRICLGCEVKDACLEYALENEERFGIWGGLSERERRRLKQHGFC